MNTFGRFVIAVDMVMVLFSAALSQSNYTEIEGRNVYYEIKGRGPTIVLIHGFSLDSRMWDPQFDALAQFYRVLRYDVSGYGRSGIPDTVISSTRELAALLKTLGIDKATLIGMSMGGGIAVDFALEYPEMVEGLITVASQLGGYSLREPTASRLRRMLTLTKDSGLAKAKEAWLNDPFLTPITPTAPIRMKIRQIVSDWSGVQFMRSTFANFLPIRPPAIRRLEQIKIPMLAVVGERDDPNMLAIADTIAERVPRAQKLVIAGSGHLLNLERPEEFNKLVREFLADSVKRR